MRHTDIRVGDRLKLKRDNPYGFGPILVNVTAIEQRDGYLVPWIRGHYRTTNNYSGLENLDFGSFKPSDFQGRA